MNDLFDLAGKVAVVTGGSRGIGKMIAEDFVRRGVRTYITSRKADACRKTAEELSEFGECFALPQDLSTTEGVRDFVTAIDEREDRLDILINNAGAAWGAPFDEFPEEGWDKVMDLNVKSVFFLTQQFAPLLRAAASAETPAKVINIASIDGIRTPDVENYSYVAAKAGLIHLTRRIAKRLVSENIHVNAIAPGAFASDLNVFARDNPDAVAAMIPSKRLGRPEDMAGAAVYMCSRAGDYLVGITLPVDGGVVFAT
jgi:2-deoxy-D-gluconate 3-dehydrogenase